MWGSSAFLLRKMSAVRYGRNLPGLTSPMCSFRPSVLFSGSTSQESDSYNLNGSKKSSGVVKERDDVSFTEVKKLLRLVNVEILKKNLGMAEEEVIGYSELLKACERMGVARSTDEAAAYAKVLDDAGVVLLFRDKVYLHPDKVISPFALFCSSFYFDHHEKLP